MAIYNDNNNSFIYNLNSNSFTIKDIKDIKAVIYLVYKLLDCHFY